MSNTGDRIKGAAEEALGNVKQGVGNLIDNEQMQAEGKATELKGEARQAAAKASERAEGVAEEVGGNIKQGVGNLIGNEQMQAEGKATELKGEARQKANQ
jgi:uncharacterized protein YjbJ (UPF0337 family)